MSAIPPLLGYERTWFEATHHASAASIAGSLQHRAASLDRIRWDAGYGEPLGGEKKPCVLSAGDLTNLDHYQ